MPVVPGASVIPGRPALRDTPCARGPGGSTAWRAGKIHRAGGGAHGPPERRRPPGSPSGTPGCCSSPSAGQLRTRLRVGVGGGWEPRARCRDPGEGPRTYLFLAPGRAGCMGCGPAWHSPAPPRVSNASAQRQDARGRGRVGCHILRAAGAPRRPDPERWGSRLAPRGCGRTGRGRRRQERLGRFATPPPALRGRPLRLLAPTSPFHPVRPRFSSVPQWRTGPPGCRPLYFTSLSETWLSFHHGSLSPVPLPLGRGLGVKGLKSLGEGSKLQNFQLLIPLVSSQKRSNSASHLPAGAPRPLGDAAAVGESGRPHVVPAVPGCRLPGDSEGHLYQSLGGTRLGLPPRAGRLHSPSHLTLESRGKWTRMLFS